MNEKTKEPTGVVWRCPVCKGGVQMSMDLYLSAIEGKEALEKEAKTPLTCSNGHPLRLNKAQQADLVTRLGAQWTPKGRWQA